MCLCWFFFSNEVTAHASFHGLCPPQAQSIFNFFSGQTYSLPCPVYHALIVRANNENFSWGYGSPPFQSKGTLTFLVSPSPPRPLLFYPTLQATLVPVGVLSLKARKHAFQSPPSLTQRLLPTSLAAIRSLATLCSLCSRAVSSSLACALRTCRACCAARRSRYTPSRPLRVIHTTTHIASCCQPYKPAEVMQRQLGAYTQFGSTHCACGICMQSCSLLVSS